MSIDTFTAFTLGASLACAVAGYNQGKPRSLIAAAVMAEAALAVLVVANLSGLDLKTLAQAVAAMLIVIGSLVALARQGMSTPASEVEETLEGFAEGRRSK